MRKLSHRVITGSVMLAAQATPEAIIGAVVGSMFPDIDIKLGIAHRTWTHWWPMYAIPLGVVGTMLHLGQFRSQAGIMMATIAFWMMMGSILHIVEDSLTVTGVPIVVPVTSPFEMNGVPWISVNKRFSLRLTHTGGLLEYGIMAISVAIAWWVVVHNPAYKDLLMGWPHSFAERLGV